MTWWCSFDPGWTGRDQVSCPSRLPRVPEPLPPLRSELSVREVISGQVWVASAPAPAGEFDRIRLRAGAASELPIALQLTEGQAAIATLHVGFQKGRERGPLRLELKRASPAPS